MWHILLWKNEDELWPEVENTVQLKEKVCERKEFPGMEEVEGVLPELCSLIRECLSYDPSERPSWERVLDTLQRQALVQATSDSMASHFWLSSFFQNHFLKEAVSLDLFLSQFYSYFGILPSLPPTSSQQLSLSNESASLTDLILVEDNFSGTEEQLRSPQFKRVTRRKKHSNPKLEKFVEHSKYKFLRYFFAGKSFFFSFWRNLALLFS